MALSMALSMALALTLTLTLTLALTLAEVFSLVMSCFNELTLSKKHIHHNFKRMNTPLQQLRNSNLINKIYIKSFSHCC
jgi:hypothetical protein